MEDESIGFHFLIPEGYQADFGNKVQTTNLCGRHQKHSSQGLPSVNIWHTTNQQQFKHRRGEYDKLVITIHDLNYLAEKGWLAQKKYDWRIQKAINKADAITCISKYVANQIEARFNMKGKPVRVIYNGVENISDAKDSKPAFATGRPFFFAIGQIRSKKNFHVLVDMMKHFPDHDLYICGDDHFDYASVVRKHIEDLPTKNAYLTGKISNEEKVWLYRNCEAFLFASMGEGFGLPAIEAMQFGKPVFIANYTCLPEICGDYGYVWQSFDSEYMATVVNNGLKEYNADASLSEKIKAHAADFSYDKHIITYMKLYKELI